MKKIWVIAWKDLLVTFRDPAALLLMLGTPIALTLVFAFAFGGSGTSDTTPERIPVALVNQDQGQLGSSIVQVFQSADLSNLVEPEIMETALEARNHVDRGQAVAAVIIPAGLTEKIIPPDATTAQPWLEPSGGAGQVEVYSDPASPITAGIVRSIVDEILSRFISGRAAAEVTIGQLVESGALTPQDAMAQGQTIGSRVGESASQNDLIQVRGINDTGGSEQGFNWLAYSAPSMAVLFLMFTVTAGSRTLLSEREWGTLPRMLVTPTTTFQVLAGKVAGIFLTGLAQMLILYLASRVMFGITWGAPDAVIVLLLALTAAATGWGILLAAYARTAPQAGALGTALTLVFGAAAGNFMPRGTLPAWLQQVSYITPNAWGLEGFTRLSAGGTLTDVSFQIGALCLMATVLFAFSTLAFRRQYA